MNAIMLSGGWESALCLIVALENNDGHAFFFNYGQPYKEQELKAVYKLQEKFAFDLSVIDVTINEIKKGIYIDRNEIFIKHIAEKGYEDIYFGCRNLLKVMDKYNDSNKQFAMKMEKKYNVSIHTPALLMPKSIVKSFVKSHGITEEQIFSSEGYVYE